MLKQQIEKFMKKKLYFVKNLFDVNKNYTKKLQPNISKDITQKFSPSEEEILL